MDKGKPSKGVYLEKCAQQLLPTSAVKFLESPSLYKRCYCTMLASAPSYGENLEVT